MRTETVFNLLCALVVATYGAPNPNPKTISYVFPGRNTGKIVGGVEADRHEFKFLVDIRQVDHKCAGSIVSPEWVVTAAHCSQNIWAGYTLVAGDHNINEVEGNEQTSQVTKIVIHPNYGYVSGKFLQNDIALRKVSPPFEFNEYVQAIAIPDTNFAPTSFATVTGWGGLSEVGAPSSNLMKIDVPRVDDDTCNTIYNNTIVPSMICYGEDVRDTWFGDLGGPILCGDNQTLCGIASWRHGFAQLNYPGVYVEPSYFGEWIRGTIAPVDENPSPVVSITTCGGRIDASSGEIKFQLGASIRANQKCVWVVKATYESVRFRLSGLSKKDGLYLTNFNSSGPVTHQRMTSVGQNYTVSSGYVLVTLSVGHAPTRGFRLEFFSSGFYDATRDITGFASLNSNSGNCSYPMGGGSYRNNENALFVINPIVPAMRTVMFTRMDVENHPYCRFDAVTVYNWFDNQYTQVTRQCGTSIPPTTTLQSGLGLVTFVSDYSVARTGFDFEWL